MSKQMADNLGKRVLDLPAGRQGFVACLHQDIVDLAMLHSYVAVQGRLAAQGLSTQSADKAVSVLGVLAPQVPLEVGEAVVHPQLAHVLLLLATQLAVEGTVPRLDSFRDFWDFTSIRLLTFHLVQKLLEFVVLDADMEHDGLLAGADFVTNLALVCGHVHAVGEPLLDLPGVVHTRVLDQSGARLLPVATNSARELSVGLLFVISHFLLDLLYPYLLDLNLFHLNIFFHLDTFF